VGIREMTSQDPFTIIDNVHEAQGQDLPKPMEKGSIISTVREVCYAKTSG
jgi:hypothetical protein